MQAFRGAGDHLVEGAPGRGQERRVRHQRSLSQQGHWLLAQNWIGHYMPRSFPALGLSHINGGNASRMPTPLTWAHLTLGARPRHPVRIYHRTCTTRVLSEGSGAPLREILRWRLAVAVIV